MSTPLGDLLKGQMKEPATDEPALEAEAGTESVKGETAETPSADNEATKEKSDAMRQEQEGKQEGEKEDKTVPLKALTEERKKWQKKVEELERRFEAAQASTPAGQEEPEIDILENPKAFQSQLQQQFEARLLEERVNLSESIISNMYDDYTDARELFLEHAQRNPALVAEVRSSSNPALTIYQKAKEIEKLNSIGNLDDWKEKERARMRDELLKEMGKSPEPETADPAASVSDAKASSNPSDEDVAAGYKPTPLKDMFGKK